MDNKNRWIIIIVVGVLLIGNIYFMMETYSLSQALTRSEANISYVQKNEKIINFTKFFIDKVLNAEGEVDFNTRLQLENDVRNLKDDEVLSLWQKFTESKTDNQAAQSVKNLLKVLMEKAN